MRNLVVPHSSVSRRDKFRTGVEEAAQAKILRFQHEYGQPRPAAVSSAAMLAAPLMPRLSSRDQILVSMLPFLHFR